MLHAFWYISLKNSAKKPRSNNGQIRGLDGNVSLLQWICHSHFLRSNRSQESILSKMISPHIAHRGEEKKHQNTYDRVHNIIGKTRNLHGSFRATVTCIFRWHNLPSYGNISKNKVLTATRSHNCDLYSRSLLNKKAILNKLSVCADPDSIFFPNDLPVSFLTYQFCFALQLSLFAVLMTKTVDMTNS